jgi:hypothetical protein
MSTLFKNLGELRHPFVDGVKFNLFLVKKKLLKDRIFLVFQEI